AAAGGRRRSPHRRPRRAWWLGRAAQCDDQLGWHAGFPAAFLPGADDAFASWRRTAPRLTPRLPFDRPGRPFGRAGPPPATGAGRPTGLDEELESMLRLLARPGREVDGRIWMQRSVRVLAAADAESERAVLVVKDEDKLTLRMAAASGLPREAISVLAPLPPG